MPITNQAIRIITFYQDSIVFFLMLFGLGLTIVLTFVVLGLDEFYGQMKEKNHE